MILLEKVSKKYGNKKILDNFSLKVDGGEFVTITGASGTGKTTLMHALLGESIDQGKIYVDEIEVNKLNDSQKQSYRRKIGIVFQDYKLLPKRSVFENVAFALEVCGFSQEEVKKRTVHALKLTGLEEQRNHFPHQLSGGEQQRTAIARALVHAPQLLFADEPTGNLDPENTVALGKLFNKINQSGTTIILTTHDKELIKTVNSRLITIDNGRVVSDKKFSN